jgi:hypothetical protein
MPEQLRQRERDHFSQAAAMLPIFFAEPMPQPVVLAGKLRIIHFFVTFLFLKRYLVK